MDIAPWEEAGIHVGAKELCHQAVVGWWWAAHLWDRCVIDRLLLLVIHGRPGFLQPIGVCLSPNNWSTVGDSAVCKNKLKIQDLIQVLFVFSGHAAATHVCGNAAVITFPPLEQG